MHDLRLTHPQVDHDSVGKIVGAIIVALMLGGFGIYTYEQGMWTTPIVSDSNLPSPGPVQ